MTETRQGRNEKAQRDDAARRATQEAQWRDSPGFTFKGPHAEKLWSEWINVELAQLNRRLIENTIQWATSLEDPDHFAERVKANANTFLRQPDSVREDVMAVLQQVWAFGEEFYRLIREAERKQTEQRA